MSKKITILLSLAFLMVAYIAFGAGTYERDDAGVDKAILSDILGATTKPGIYAEQWADIDGVTVRRIKDTTNNTICYLVTRSYSSSISISCK